MKKIILSIIIVVRLTNINAQDTAHETEGNLETTKPLNCVCISEVKSSNTPPDILNGMAKCIELGEYIKAARLFAIAGVYGKYDSYRVYDKTAHQALRVLQQNIILNINENQRDSLIKAIGEEIDTESKSLIEICTDIKKVGMPDYYPKYMVQHGINAFIEENNEESGLVEGFDSIESWNMALTSYLHCDN
jgi:hypothetical protein